MIRAVALIGLPAALLAAAASCKELDGDGSPTDPVDTVTVDEGTAQCRNGRAFYFPCKDVDLVGRLELHEMAAEAPLNDLWGWTDPRTGIEWVLVGHAGGTSFVGLRDPTEPFYAGQLPKTSSANSSTWRDMKVYANHAYIVADGAGDHGMQVFDLVQLRNATAPPRTFTATAHYDGIASAHNIVINEETGFAYAVGSNGGGETCGGGLHMIDIREPHHPTFVGCFAHTATGYFDDGYTHDAMCTVYQGPDAEHRGREICFGANENALSIADVTDKDNPVALASARYPKVGYAHQAWLDESHAYLYMNDEWDEFDDLADRTRTLVWDVADLDDPFVVTEAFGETPASDHNLYIDGDYMYQSNYRAGLRIFSIADRENPVEIAFFDVETTTDNRPGFDGSWSNYPFFRSGIIAVNNMDVGLFLLRHTGR